MEFLEEIKTNLAAFRTNLTDIPSETNLVELSNFLIFLQQELDLLLQKSILAGEYYEDSATTLVSEIEGEIDSIGFLTSSKNSTLQEIDIVKIRTACNTFSKKYIEPYKQLILKIPKNLKDYHSGKERDYFDIWIYQNNLLKDEFTESIYITNNKKSSSSEEILNVSTFKVNLLLAYLDEYLQCNDKIKNELINIKQLLNKLFEQEFSNEILPLLIDKVEFLCFKVDYRDNHPSLTLDESDHKFPEISDSNVYSCLFKQVRDHYCKYTAKKVAQKELEAKSIKSITTNQLNLEPFHYLIRYYKKKADERQIDLSKAIQELETSIRKLNEFNECIKVYIATNGITSLSEFNQIALRTIQNSLNNTVLYLDARLQKKKKFSDISNSVKKYIKGTSTNEETLILNNMLSQVKERSNNGEIQDYYGFYIFIDFLNGMMRYFKSHPGVIIDPEKDDYSGTTNSDKRRRIKEMIGVVQKLYDDAFSNLRKNLKGLSSHKSLPVYMTWNECIIKPDNKVKFPLFLRSSYILPNNFGKIESEIKSWEIFFHAQQRALTDTFEVALSQLEIKKSILEFEKRVKENEFKVVQIVAMFVSIATFVLLSVKIFDNKTGLESFAILIGLAACFFLFNIFFYFIIHVQNNQHVFDVSKKIDWKYWRKPLYFLIPPVTFGLISFSILLFANTNSNTEVKNLILKVDSVKNIAVHDSLKILAIEQKFKEDTIKLLQDSLRSLSSKKGVK